MPNSKSSGNGRGGRGGFFPFSNLSPLAPPFTVDRFVSASGSLSNSFGNSTESMRARNFSSPRPYQFSASESVSHLPLVTPDLYSYWPFSHSVATSLAEANPFYQLGPMTLPGYKMSNSFAGLANETSHYVGKGCEISGTIYYAPEPRRENNTGSLCAKCLKEPASFQNGYVSARRKTIIIRPPDAGCVPSVSNISLRQENSSRDPATCKERELSHHPVEPDQSTEDKAHLEENKHVICLERNGGEPATSSKTSTKDASDRFVRACSEPQVPPIIERGKLKSVHDSSEAVSSGEDSSKNLDHNDLSVDSPCWKGATTSRFTPLQYLEAVANFILMEDEEASCSSFEGHPDDDSVRVFSEKVSDDNAYYDDGSQQNALPPSLIPPIAVYPPGESRPNAAGKEESICLESEPRTHNECALLNSSECDENSKSGHTVKPTIGEVISEETQTTGINVNDTTQDGSSAVPVVQHVPGSLSGEDGSMNLREVCREERAPSIDLHRLVMTMCSLSELFLHNSSDPACMLSGNDHIALCHIINNLNVFVSNNDKEMIPSEQLPQLGASVFLEQSPLEERSVERPIMTNGTAANAKNLPDYPQFLADDEQLNQANVEEPSSSGVHHPSHDLTNGSPYKLPRTESFPPILGIHVDDADDSVMARFKDLKCRIDHSRLDEQELMKAPDLGLVGNASLIRGELEGAIFDPYMECSTERHTTVSFEGGLFGNFASVPREEPCMRAGTDARRQYILAHRGANRHMSGFII